MEKKTVKHGILNTSYWHQNHGSDLPGSSCIRDNGLVFELAETLRRNC